MPMKRILTVMMFIVAVAVIGMLGIRPAYVGAVCSSLCRISKQCSGKGKISYPRGQSVALCETNAHCVRTSNITKRQSR